MAQMAGVEDQNNIVPIMLSELAEYSIPSEVEHKLLSCAILLASLSSLFVAGQICLSVGRFMNGHEVQSVAGVMSAVVVGAGMSTIAVFSTRPLNFWGDERFRWLHRILGIVLISCQVLDFIQTIFVILNLVNHNDQQNSIWWTEKTISKSYAEKHRICLICLIGSTVQLVTVASYCFVFGIVAKIHRQQPNSYDQYRNADQT